MVNILDYLINIWLEYDQRVDVDGGGGEGHEGGVETIEHASMTWENMSGIFDAKGALEERFYKIAPGAEDDNDESETSPLES